MGVATTYNPGSMSRFNAILLFVRLAGIAGILGRPTGAHNRATGDEIDPQTGLARTTVVRPLQRRRPRRATRRAPVPVVAEPHVALILPTASPALGRLAEAVQARASWRRPTPRARTACRSCVMPVDNESAGTRPGLQARRSRPARSSWWAAFTRDGATDAGDERLRAPARARAERAARRARQPRASTPSRSRSRTRRARRRCSRWPTAGTRRS